MKIYVAGKITGLARRAVLDKFGKAGEALAKQGHEVFVPCVLPDYPDVSHDDYGRTRMKKKLRIFECKPYEIALDSGKKIKVTDDVFAGEVFKDGSFYGAVFSDCRFEGEVRFDPDCAKERLGKELFLKETE